MWFAPRLAPRRHPDRICGRHCKSAASRNRKTHATRPGPASHAVVSTGFAASGAANRCRVRPTWCFMNSKPHLWGVFQKEFSASAARSKRDAASILILLFLLIVISGRDEAD